MAYTTDDFRNAARDAGTAMSIIPNKGVRNLLDGLGRKLGWAALRIGQLERRVAELEEKLEVAMNQPTQAEVRDINQVRRGAR